MEVLWTFPEVFDAPHSSLLPEALAGDMGDILGAAETSGEECAFTVPFCLVAVSFPVFGGLSNVIQDREFVKSASNSESPFSKAELCSTTDCDCCKQEESRVVLFDGKVVSTTTNSLLFVELGGIYKTGDNFSEFITGFETLTGTTKSLLVHTVCLGEFGDGIVGFSLYMAD